MPSTPWAMADSKPADWRGRIVLTVLLDQRDIELSALSRAIFIMWTKKGNLSTGNREDDLELFVLPRCCGGASERYAGQKAKQQGHSKQPRDRPLSTHRYLLCKRGFTRSTHRGPRVTGLRAINLDTTRIAGSYPWGTVAPCTTPSDQINRATRRRALASFLLHRHRSHRASPRGRLAAIDRSAPLPGRVTSMTLNGLVRSPVTSTLAGGVWQVDRDRR